MSETTANLRRKIKGAEDLATVVRTMKALAASSIGQYEHAMKALSAYYRTVELGLGLCFRTQGTADLAIARRQQAEAGTTLAIVFGSDQGLVGKFNEVVADYAVGQLSPRPGRPQELQVLAVGERVHERLSDAGLQVKAFFPLPSSVKGVAALVGQLQIECEVRSATGGQPQVYVFHNRPHSGTLYSPVSQRLLPLDTDWLENMAKTPWPRGTLPEIVGDPTTTLGVLISEYLFISLFGACAESLASENSSRLAAMQRAEKNIGDLLENLTKDFHHLRQSSIDEELFDVIAGFEALSGTV